MSRMLRLKFGVSGVSEKTRIGVSEYQSRNNVSMKQAEDIGSVALCDIG
jgi:hypothetical protein